MRRRTILVTGLAVLALLLSLPGLVAANTDEPIAETGGMTATIPLLGTSLSVDVHLDDVGKITTVDVDPTDGLSQTRSHPGYVRFATSDGTTSVSVLAHGGRLAITERTTLQGLTQGGGAGTWSADVFGTGSKTIVHYTLGKDADGHPTVTLGAIAAAAGITATSDTPKTTSEDGAKGSSMKAFSWARAGVTFTYQGWTKHLTISLTAAADGQAALRITLSGRDRQKLTGTLAQLAGARTWSAHLCDGTAVSVGYHMASDGTVVFDSAAGAPATHATIHGALWVHFKGSWVGMVATVRQQQDGTYKLVVRGLSGICGPAFPHRPRFSGPSHSNGDPDGTSSTPDPSTTSGTSGWLGGWGTYGSGLDGRAG